jgi:hypothetical protein
VSLIPAAHNPNVVTRIDPRTDPYQAFSKVPLLAAKAFAGVLTGLDDKIRPIDELVRLNGEGNIVAFGSPTSNLVARIAMRYAEVGDGRRGAEYYPTDALGLKILFELNGERIINSQDTAHRSYRSVVNGKEEEIPNWGIRRLDGSIICPEMQGGTPVQDYLVISNLPNLFNSSSFSNGHRIINFGGTHSAGTRAVQRLMQDEVTLQKLHDGVRALQGNRSEFPYWQARILVDGVIPDGPPLRLDVMEVEEVEVNVRGLEALVSANMQELRQLGST